MVPDQSTLKYWVSWYSSDGPAARGLVVGLGDAVGLHEAARAHPTAALALARATPTSGVVR